MKIKFCSNGNLPLYKKIEIPVVTTVVRAVFDENKYYPQDFLDEYLHKMIYYHRTDVSEGIDVNKARASKECDVCHYWYFLRYSFNHVSAIDVMIY